MPAYIKKPPVDIIDGVDRYIILMDLPGVKAEDIEINGYDTYIEISGVKKPDYSGNYLLMERFSGRFKRKISFKNPVDISQAKAELNNGVLKIEIPKTIEKIVITKTTIIIRR